jgi:iron complex outermembrane recepter protein
VPTGFGSTPTPDTNISGNQLIRAPRFSGNLGVNYHLDTNAGAVGAYTGLYYNSGYPLEVSGSIRQRPYATLDAELSFAPVAVKNLRLVAWGKNLTDRAYLASLLQSNFSDGASYTDPRTFGVRAEFGF